MFFASPKYLWLLSVLVPMAGYYIYRLRSGSASIRISSVRGVAGVPPTAKYYMRHLPFVLRCAAVALLVVALARPQSASYNSRTTTEGIDIVMAVDISGSMLARDFEPDRISAAKEVASRFIVDRSGDRIGLVVFAGESFTQSPLTSDHRALLNLLAQVRSGMMEDGTAIGNGLATAINRLRESEAKSKVIILLTDGVNNAGQIAPLTAADIARSYGIRVYTIGVGSMGTAPYPALDMWGNLTYVAQRVEIDEDVLRKIAAQTGGEYFRATDKSTLSAIYGQINTLERNKIETDDYTNYDELFARYALLAVGLLIVEFLLNTLYLRRLP